jgi:hypothetical protein
MRWWIRVEAALADIRGQLRNNAIALISLLVALTSVSYSTWRPLAGSLECPVGSSA